MIKRLKRGTKGSSGIPQTSAEDTGINKIVCTVVSKKLRGAQVQVNLARMALDVVVLIDGRRPSCYIEQIYFNCEPGKLLVLEILCKQVIIDQGKATEEKYTLKCHIKEFR